MNIYTLNFISSKQCFALRSDMTEMLLPVTKNTRFEKVLKYFKSSPYLQTNKSQSKTEIYKFTNWMYPCFAQSKPVSSYQT